MRKGKIDIIKYTEYSHDICYGQTVLYQDRLYFVYDAKVKKRLRLMPNEYKNDLKNNKSLLIEADCKDLDFVVIIDVDGWYVPIEYSLHERALKDKGQNILFDTQILHPQTQESSLGGYFSGFRSTAIKYRLDRTKKTIQVLIKELEKEVV